MVVLEQVQVGAGTLQDASKADVRIMVFDRVVTVSFARKPAADVIAQLKELGARWNGSEWVVQVELRPTGNVPDPIENRQAFLAWQEEKNRREQAEARRLGQELLERLPWTTAVDATQPGVVRLLGRM